MIFFLQCVLLMLYKKNLTTNLKCFIIIIALSALHLSLSLTSLIIGCSFPFLPSSNEPTRKEDILLHIGDLYMSRFFPSVLNFYSVSAAVPLKFFCRLIQYTSRLVWHQLELRNANKYSVDRIKNLELTFSSFRKSKLFLQSKVILIHKNIHKILHNCCSSGRA